jgi:hypothetical protein
LLRVAKSADDLGFDGFFRSGHYLTFDAATADTTVHPLHGNCLGSVVRVSG